MSVPAASERLTAVLRAAQYLSNLSPEQDPWAELAQAMGSFFGSDLVLILRPGDGGEPQLVHEPFSQGISVSEVLRLTRAEIRAVFETGFLGSQILTAPACSLSLLPLPRDRRTAAVVIIGRAGQEPFSKEELEILLALGGLFGNVVARVETERELRSHRQSLEELVAQRTAELESTTARLVQESAERRQAQAALEQAHAELEQILETAADGLRVIDRHGTLLRINATHARRLGRPISEVLGRKCDEVSRCLDCESEACPIKRIAAGASRVESEMTRDYPEGTRDEIVISTPFRAKDGTLLGIVQVFHDVTERKRAEEALRQSREWLRVTLTSIGDAVIACDTAGRVTFINPVAARLAGWPAEEALAQPVERIFRIINEHTRTPAEDVVARVLRERRTTWMLPTASGRCSSSVSTKWRLRTAARRGPPRLVRSGLRSSSATSVSPAWRLRRRSGFQGGRGAQGHLPRGPERLRAPGGRAARTRSRLRPAPREAAQLGHAM